MKRFLPLLFLVSSCSSQSMAMDSYGSALSQKRQKQKLIVLQKKLDAAEKQQMIVAREVDRLKEEMSQSELAVIRGAVEVCEMKLARHQSNIDQVAGLFLEEREVLHKMIQSGSSPTSFEAQVVLDQILRMITNLSETQ